MKAMRDMQKIFNTLASAARVGNLEGAVHRTLSTQAMMLHIAVAVSMPHFDTDVQRYALDVFETIFQRASQPIASPPLPSLNMPLIFRIGGYGRALAVGPQAGGGGD